MHNKQKNITLVSFLFLFIFIGVLITPIPQPNNLPKNTALTIDNLDFGNGKDVFITKKDSELYPGSSEYNSVTINHKLIVSNTNTKIPLSIKAQKSIIINKSGSIDYSNVVGSTSIKPEAGKNIAGSGGSFGGAGGLGRCLTNPRDNNNYKIDTLPAFGESGSIGLSSNKGIVGKGGGFILLESPEVTINGSIFANGGNGTENGGGGSGGKIVILTKKLTINGILSATGGIGGTSFVQGAGGGGGGIIILSVNYNGSGKVDVSGGNGGKALDIYTGCDGQSGDSGIIAKP